MNTIILLTYLFTQFPNQRISLCISIDKSRTIQVTHWKINHTAMAPKSARMEREPIWKEPDFWWYRVVAFTYVVNQEDMLIVAVMIRNKDLVAYIKPDKTYLSSPYNQPGTTKTLPMSLSLPPHLRFE